MPELSIIVTSYNIEDYLGECMRSVTNQTLRDIEIIVVDDGSTDRSPAIIEELAANDDRIVPLILGTNSVGGVATAANAGLDVATSPYVGFADGDDIYELDMFERLLDAAKADDADLAICNYRTFRDGSNHRPAPADERRFNELSPGLHRLDPDTRRAFLRLIAVPWRKIYRRELLEANKIRFPVGDYFYEDNPFHWFSLFRATSITVVPDVLCYHRVARPGQTMNTADERLFKIFEHHHTIHEFLKQNDGLADYQSTLLGWAISQAEWISQRTPDDLRPRLFEVLRGVLEPYTISEVETALVDGNKGQRGRALTLAVANGNLGAFNDALDGAAKQQSPLARGIHHLRYSGPKRTAQITAKYAKQRAQRVIKSSPMSRSTGQIRRERDVSNRDLLFALMVLEERISRIETKLDGD